jgi:hypothetical protein
MDGECIPLPLVSDLSSTVWTEVTTDSRVRRDSEASIKENEHAARRSNYNYKGYLLTTLYTATNKIESIPISNASSINDEAPRYKYSIVPGEGLCCMPENTFSDTSLG